MSPSDLGLPPNLMSLVRLPLAVAFPFATGTPRLALGIMAAAAASDVLDGWMARRTGKATALGALVDPLADKVFTLAVVVTLLVRRMLPLWALPALLARELLEAPLLAWIGLHPGRRAARAGHVRANLAGKLATVAQFGALAAAVALPQALPVALAACAVVGVTAGLSYWARELHETRTAT